jgi:hypothetical protein
MRSLLAWLGLGSVLTAGYVFTGHTAVPGYAMALPVLGTVMLVAAGSGISDSSQPLVVRLLGKQPLRWIGDVSYGFYLWHWPFLILGAAYLGHRLDKTTTLALLCAALVTAWLSYEMLENPIRRARILSRRPRLALLLWPVALSSLLVVNVASHGYINHERAAVAAAAAQVDLSNLPPAQRAHRDTNRVHNQIADSIDRATLNAPQAPVHLEEIGPWLRDRDCSATPESATRHRICVLGDVHGSRRMVAFGNSHILMWLATLQPIAQRDGYQLIPITKLGCTPYDVVAWSWDRNAEYTACNQWRSWALRQVKLLRPDVVVVGSASVVAATDVSTGRPLPPDQARLAWRAGARSLASQLIAITPEVRILQDINRLPWDPVQCLSDLDHSAADCTFAPSRSVTESNQLVRSGIAGTGARFVPLRDLFCMQGRCPTVIDDIQVYADDDHITRTYARHLVDDVEPRLRLPN